MTLYFLGTSYKSKVDLCFIIDTTDTINSTNPSDGSYDNWNLLIQFVVSLAKTYIIGPNAAQIGLVQFAKTAHVVFPLNAHDNQNTMVQAIKNMKQTEGPRNTTTGLFKARKECFSPESGDRKGIPNLAVLITHGTPASPEAALDAAKELRDSEVTVFAVGITDDVDKTFLSKLSSPPQVLE